MTTSSTPRHVDLPSEASVADPARPWRTVVWDDPVNLMSYVSWVFRTYLRLPAPAADALMLKVHHEGRAVVASGSREKMETDVYALQSYGLWATLEQEH